MRLVKGLFASGLLLTTPAFAADHAIRAYAFSYPSPGAVHYDIIVRELVSQAVAKCGAEEKVEGLAAIDLSVKGGVDDLVGRLDGEGGLDFWYPKITATATVRCAD
jgi:hypothetical protein